MATSRVSAVLVHGAWADGSSWAKVVIGLRSNGIKAVTAPLSLTTLSDDIAALNRIYPVTAQNAASFPGKQLTAANSVSIFCNNSGTES